MTETNEEGRSRKMQPTKSQHEAITARNTDLVVSAGAGSGKTSVLVRRILDMALKDDAPVMADRILCVTFTVSAANELRARIQNELRKHAGTSELAREQSKRFRRAAIGTIHSFCLSVIRDYWQILEISPDFTMADEMTQHMMRYDAMTDTLEILYADDKSGFPEFAELFGRSRTDSDAAEAIFRLFDFLGTQEDPEEWISGIRKDIEDNVRNAGVFNFYISKCLTVAETACRMLENAVKKLWMTFPDDGSADRYADFLNGELTDYRHCADLLRKGDISGVAEFLDTRDKGRFPSKKKNSDEEYLIADIKKLREYAKDKLIYRKLYNMCSVKLDDEYDRERTAAAFDALVYAYRVFDDQLTKRKTAQKTYDFNDLEKLTVKLLSNTEVREELQSRFDAVFVDEYQDVNPIQDYIFRMLTEKKHDLFAVGDIKQSIYGFRKADPKVFRRKIEDGEDPEKKDIRHIALLENFRSAPQVIDAVNSIFTGLMTEELGGIDYRREVMVSAGSLSEIKGTGIDYCQCEVDDKEDISYEVADYIGRMIDSGYLISDNGTLRKAEPRDFCVLLRKGSGRGVRYMHALKERGIPCVSGSGSALFENDEIAVCISLLRLIDNPMRDADAVTVMVSPMFGFTPDELLRLKTERPGSLFRAALTSSSKKARDFAEEINGYRHLASAVSPADLIQNIIIDSDNIVLLCAGEMMQEKLSNIRSLQAIAAQFSERGGTLQGFLRLCERAADGGSARVAAQASTGNSVTVSTIHGAKGLEWPVVIVSDEEKPFNLRDASQPVLFDNDLGMGIKVKREGTDGLPVMHKTLRYMAISAKIHDNILSEEMRLQYVALTRAKQKIAVFSKHKADKIEDKLSNAALFVEYPELAAFEGSAFGWVAADLRAMKMRGTADIITQPSKDPSAQPGTQIREEKIDRESVISRIGYRYPHLATTTIQAKRSVTSIVEGNIGVSLPAITRGGRVSAAVRGTSVHLVLQCMDLEKGRQDLEKELERLRRRGFVTDEQLKTVDREKLQKFLDSPLADEMMSNSIHREYEFMFYMKAGELDKALPAGAKDEEVLINGISDCVIEKENSVVIVDYKTDKVKDAAELVDRYRGQLELYRRAIGPRFSKPVEKCVIWSFELSEEVPVDV